MERVELQSLLSGKHDHRDCFFTISAGDGGTEANDWCEMLLRMYLYFFESSGWKIEEVEKSYGTEVGLDSVTLHIKGDFVFGYLNCERGTHRLARVSPFNAQGKRQTSFATVDVTPEFEETDVEIPEKDLDIQAFARSSGPGGQNVNKVASAIRLVHKPTGIMVVSRAPTATSCKISRQADGDPAGQARAARRRTPPSRDRPRRLGRQARAPRLGRPDPQSYVLYDNRVKDHRTNHEVGNPQSVLDGALEGFIDAELKRRRSLKG